MRLLYLLDEDCPVHTKMYGGLPSGGFFNSNTEYEIGAQRCAEAAHCLLGSLGKVVNWKNGPRDWMPIEQDHIEEELGIILKAVREYSRGLYIDDRHFVQHTYGQESVKSIREAAPKLRQLAGALRSEVEIEDPLIRDAAMATYNFVMALAEAMEESVQSFPRIHQNAFNETWVRLRADALEKSVKAMLAHYLEGEDRAAAG